MSEAIGIDIIALISAWKSAKKGRIGYSGYTCYKEKSPISYCASKTYRWDRWSKEL